MPRIRTLSETLQHIKELDPESALTANALRRMVISGEIPHIRAGKKYLIDLDMLFQYLKGDRPGQIMPDPEDTAFNWRAGNHK